jgi:FkbM family methyltransferase
MKRALRTALAFACRNVHVRGRARAFHLLGPHLLPPDGLATRPLAGYRLPLNLRDEFESTIYYGLYEEAELRRIRSALDPGDVFVDVGAHIGLYTLLAAGLVGPTGAVHAFEPLPANFQRLQSAVRLNGMQHVRLNQTAVGRAEGTMRLHPYAGKGHASFAMASRYGSRDEAPTVVPMTTLDAYAARHRLRRIDAVKVDVEGAEWDVFQGMRTVLRDVKPRVILTEVWTADAHARYHGGAAPEQLPSPDDLAGLLRGFGYRVAPIHPRPAPDGVDNILCVRSDA